MERIVRTLAMLVAVGLAMPLPGARVPEGRIAVSCGEGVALVNPADGQVVPVPTGPLGWLYPAPGGMLYAPDTRRGRTTAIDLATGRVADTFKGLMMPVFGAADERYVDAVRGRVLIAAYPDRLVLEDWEVPLERPWRVRISNDGLTLYVLDRPRQGGAVVKIDLLSGRVQARVALPREPDEMILLEELGILAVAYPELEAVELRSGTSLTVEGIVHCPGSPAGLAFDGSRSLLVAVAGDGDGAVVRYRIRRKEKEGLDVREKDRLELPAVPGRLAGSPDGRWVAASGRAGGLWIADSHLGKIERSVELPGPGR